MSARDNFRVPIDRVVTCVPDAEDASGPFPRWSRYIGTSVAGRNIISLMDSAGRHTDRHPGG